MSNFIAQFGNITVKPSPFLNFLEGGGFGLLYMHSNLWSHTLLPKTEDFAMQSLLNSRSLLQEVVGDTEAGDMVFREGDVCGVLVGDNMDLVWFTKGMMGEGWVVGSCGEDRVGWELVAAAKVFTKGLMLEDKLELKEDLKLQFLSLLLLS